MKEISPLLFNSFCENLLRDKDSLELVEYGCNIIYFNWKELKELHALWHIEEARTYNNFKGYILWRRKAWNNHIEHLQQLEQDRKEYESILEERREVFFKLCYKICELLGLDKDQHTSLEVRAIAEKALEKKSKNAAEILNLSLENVREFPKERKHTVLNERGKEDYKI